MWRGSGHGRRHPPFQEVSAAQPPYIGGPHLAAYGGPLPQSPLLHPAPLCPLTALRHSYPSRQRAQHTPHRQPQAQHCHPCHHPPQQGWVTAGSTPLPPAATCSCLPAGYHCQCPGCIGQPLAVTSRPSQQSGWAGRCYQGAPQPLTTPHPPPLPCLAKQQATTLTSESHTVDGPLAMQEPAKDIHLLPVLAATASSPHPTCYCLAPQHLLQPTHLLRGP